MAKNRTSREELEARRNDDGTFPVDGLVEASVLCAFFIQALGKASTAEVVVKIAELGGDIDEHLATQACEALQGRGIISYARGRKAGSGESVRQWKMRRAIWSAAPEIAQITELLPRLVETDEARELIDVLNAGEEDGEGEKKATRKLGYDHYYDVVAHLLTVDELLGSQPASPYLDSLVAKFPHGNVSADLRFWRDSMTGGLMIGADVVRGWLRTGLRTAGFADAAGGYVAAEPIVFQPHRPLVQLALPVIDMKSGGGAGKGISSYECVAPGQEIVLRLRLPARGLLEPARFQLWLAAYAMRPIRGLSPARGGRFGRMALTSFVTLGEMRSAKSAIASVVELVPEPARRLYQSMAGALDIDDVVLRKGVTG